MLKSLCVRLFKVAVDCVYNLMSCVHIFMCVCVDMIHVMRRI